MIRNVKWKTEISLDPHGCRRVVIVEVRGDITLN